MTLKYAIIGCGRIASNHIAAAKNNKLEIVALCDLHEGAMDDKIEKLNLGPSVKKYTDYKEMLEKEEIDLVAIATVSGVRAKIALDCIEAGCNLIIEKPIALSLEDADKIIEKAKEKGVKVSSCHQNRFNKSIQKIRSAIEDNKLGRLFHGTAHIRWNRNQDYFTQASWRGTWDKDGGTLMNQCIHSIDLLRWMMGSDIEEVVGMTDNLNHDFIETEDLGLALIKFTNGSYGVVEGTVNIYPKNLEETIYIFGEKGTIKAGGSSVNSIEIWNVEGEEDPEKVMEENSVIPPKEFGFGHTPLYADTVDAIVNDREPYINAEEGRRAIELVLAIQKSAAEGKPVRLPLTSCSATDFKGRFK